MVTHNIQVQDKTTVEYLAVSEHASHVNAHAGQGLRVVTDAPVRQVQTETNNSLP